MLIVLYLCIIHRYYYAPAEKGRLDAMAMSVIMTQVQHFVSRINRQI